GHVKDGCIQCPYHGWQFDGHGRCVSIPSQCAGDVMPSGAQVPAYPVREQDGYVWVFVGEGDPGELLPYRLPHAGEAGWGESRFDALVRNSVDNVVENFIDCPHTGYVHGGLFRQPASHKAETTVRRAPDGIIIEIEEETQADSLLGRLLVPKGGKVEHIDRFVMPSIVQVTYRFGPNRQVIGHQICTPISPFETRVFAHTAWQLGWMTPLIRPFVGVVGRRILQQDLRILENQGEQIKRHGEHYVSTAADTANVWIRAFRQAAGETRPSGDGVTREKRVTFRL
ncbi:MAG: Rieske 2Fe-2S domain-containing protein, partial [Candidatus Sericytochromatia bacterium]|nr:Rieske 2Fe-2S domain-containing protein [Candidatus Sericytochromatia bacterium]